MTHHAQHMIALKYLETPKHRVYRTAYRMHLGGLDNMRNDAQTSGWRHWKIHKECVETGAIVETLATKGKPTGWHFETITKTELTPAGEQHVIPGCERNASPKASQLDLFG